MSTNYTHFTNLAFDSLFARGADGSETTIIDASGNFTVPTALKAPNGTQASPSISFSSFTGHGLFIDPSAHDIGVSISGTYALEIGSTRCAFFTPLYVGAGTAGSPGLSFQTQTGSGIYQQGNGIGFAVLGTEVAAFASASISFLQPVSLKGTTTNNSASAGVVGEYLVSTQSTATNCATSLQFTDATSLSLTAGDWEISGCVSFIANGATLSNACEVGISITSGNSASGLVETLNYVQSTGVPNSTDHYSLSVMPYRVSLSSTTTHYLKAMIAYSAGTPQFKGTLRARRVR